MQAQLNTTITAIHNAAPMIVYHFAGAGSQALMWLHSVGGSSRTLLEATDSYAASSLTEMIGYQPAHFATPAVARAMATQAFIRACRLATPGASVAGVACSAAIATDRPKRGEHRVCVAVCTGGGVVSFNLALAKGARSRAEEESLASLLVLQAVAQASQVEFSIPLPLQAEERIERQVEVAGVLERLLSGEFQLVTAWPDGRLVPNQFLSNVALFSGAFNPLHPGHQELASLAASRLEQTVYFELPLTNADKGAIAVTEARRRLAQFAHVGSVLLTRAPLFNQKAQLFPHSTFVIGADTALRLVQPRFYHDDRARMLASLDEIRMMGCRFLVAGRLFDGQFLTLADISLPAGYRELFEQIPESEFRLDISSTELRGEDPASL